ncbi:hypothetical protein ACWEQ7_04355 [Streptomyces sp. NPDC004069]
MTGYDPTALRSLARRYAASPSGGFPGFGILAYSGALEASVRWAEREQGYMTLARSIGVTESDARTVLDEVVTERQARWLDVNCDDTFREARGRLYTKILGPAPELKSGLVGDAWAAPGRATKQPSRVANAEYRQRLRNRVKRRRR